MKVKNQYLKILEYLLFFESTIMGNTADLAMVQKTIIVSHRGSLLKGGLFKECCIKAY